MEVQYFRDVEKETLNFTWILLLDMACKMK